jgi:hypothetical protein
VATEAQIIAISVQLAGVARQAGLTADQLVGLSTALASVGIQPELARGTITRIFGRIGQAIAVGGDQLNEFGKIAGTTGAEFGTAFKEDASSAFLQFLRGLGERGDEAEASLRALGITSVRDVPALLRLAQTSESILAPALGVAAKGFEDGTELADQYGIIAGTTAERLRRLQQNIEQLNAELGKGVLAFEPVIESLSNIIKLVRDVVKIPVVGFFAQLAVIGTAAAGVFLLMAGGAVRLGASFLAVSTSLTELNRLSAGQTVTLTGLIKATYGAAFANGEALNVSNAAVAGSTTVATSALVTSGTVKNGISAANIQLTATNEVLAASQLRCCFHQNQNRRIVRTVRCDESNAFLAHCCRFYRDGKRGSPLETAHR